MKKRTKIILAAIATTIIVFISMLALSFYTMQIEDQYGDLQEIFYKSKDGDLIVEENKRFGFIEKNWTTIHIFSNNNSQDLYNWVNQEQHQIKFSVYRPLNNTKNFNNLSLNEVANLIKNKQLEFIIGN